MSHLADRVRLIVLTKLSQLPGPYFLGALSGSVGGI
jgi:hypothetical protein